MHKTNFICFKISKPIIILLFVILIQIVFILIEVKELIESKNLEQIKNDVVSMENTLNQKNETKIENKINTNEIKILQNTDYSSNTEKTVSKQEEYKNMPNELKGYKVIGKIEIPKLELNTYILGETNTKSLKVSVTKLYGPDINKVGNFCIAGHNYRNNKMFGGIKKLEEGDEIILTDTYDKKVTYKVYKNYQVDPKDVSALAQNTGGEREITLITCTAGAVKRVIVKAVEDYD